MDIEGGLALALLFMSMFSYPISEKNQKRGPSIPVLSSFHENTNYATIMIMTIVFLLM